MHSEPKQSREYISERLSLCVSEKSLHESSGQEEPHGQKLMVLRARKTFDEIIALAGNTEAQEEGPSFLSLVWLVPPAKRFSIKSAPLVQGGGLPLV